MSAGYRRYAILFVDDEEMARKYFERAFGGEFRVLTAPSVADALALLDDPQQQIGVLVTDQRMPRQTGLDLLQEARARHPHVIRLLTTAYASLDDAVAAVNRGEVFRYLSKPWDLNVLRQELQNAVALFLAQQYDRDLLAERRRTMYSIAACVAHEMRTPLLSVSAAAGGIRRYLPALLKAYDAAQAKGLEVPELRLAHRQALAEAADRIEQTARSAQTVIDLLLVNAKLEDFPTASYRRHGMWECVQEALGSYPFASGERERVHVEQVESFEFVGSDVLMVYVLFNLLRNALYALQAAGRGEIRIRLQRGETDNLLIFRDTGTGMDPATRAHVFDDFFTRKPGHAGTGMGLSFCRRVVESFGGGIDCESAPGAFTEFRIRLPAPD